MTTDIDIALLGMLWEMHGVPCVATQIYRAVLVVVLIAHIDRAVNIGCTGNLRCCLVGSSTTGVVSVVTVFEQGTLEWGGNRQRCTASEGLHGHGDGLALVALYEDLQGDVRRDTGKQQLHVGISVGTTLIQRGCAGCCLAQEANVATAARCLHQFILPIHRAGYQDERSA